MKDVKGFEDYFAITEDGKLWSKRSKKFLKQNVSKTGYYTVATRIGGRHGKSYCFRVHRLVAFAFIDNPDDKPFVNHKDGNKLNNHKDNLEWCTNQENIIHAVQTGLLVHKKGTESKRSKLSKEDIEYIREHYKSHCKVNGTRALGKRFGVHYTRISAVVLNKTYKED